MCARVKVTRSAKLIHVTCGRHGGDDDARDARDGGDDDDENEDACARAAHRTSADGRRERATGA